MRQLAFGLFACLLLAVVGCGGGHPAAASIRGTPSVSALPTPYYLPPATATTTPPVPPAGTRPCPPEDLQTRIERVGAGAGRSEHLILFQNQSPNPCQLDGIPGLQLMDQVGNSLPTTLWDACNDSRRVIWFRCPPQQPVLLLPLGETARSNWSGEASIHISTSSSLVCPPQAVNFASIRVTLPSGGSLDVPWVNDTCFGGLGMSWFLPEPTSVVNAP